MNRNIRMRNANEDFMKLQESQDNDFNFNLDSQLNDMT